MKSIIPATVALAIGLLALNPSARADSLTTGSKDSGTFDMLEASQSGVFTAYTGLAGGNISGSSGVINGTSYNFAEMYCVDLFTDSTLSTTYSGLYNQNGVINGITLPAGGQIAWLILNIAPHLTTQSQYQGLQGLIWTLENPGTVKWDTADNSLAATIAYFSYSIQLGANVAPVNSVWWINPTNSQGVYAYQGFVAATSTQITRAPEPASIALLAAGIAGIGLSRRRGART